MATSTTATGKTERAANFVADTAKQSSEQMLGVIRQTTKLTLDATSSWFDTVANVVPVAPDLPFGPSKATVQKWVSLGFETAESVIAMQRDLTSEIVAKLAPAS